MMRKGIFCFCAILTIFSYWKIDRVEASDYAPDLHYNELSDSLVTPHIPFASPYYKGKIKTLVIAPTWTQRETIELAQRLSIDYVPLMTESYDKFGPYHNDSPGWNTFGISTEEFRTVVNRTLDKEADYDLIIIGKIAWTVFPQPVQKMLLDKVKRGTGLLYICPAGLDKELADALKENGDAGGFITKGVPINNIPIIKDVPLSKLLRTGNLGRGRIACIDYGQKSRGLESLTPCQSNDPLFYDYYYSLLAKAALWTAKETPGLYFENLAIDKNVISREELPATAVNFVLKGPIRPDYNFQYIIRDMKNRVEFENKKSLPGERNSFPLPSLKTGEKILDIWIRDKEKIIDWASIPFSVTAPLRIEEVTLDKDIYRRDETIRGQISFSGPLPCDVSPEAAVYDNYNRQVNSPVIKLKEKNAEFSFRVNNPLTYSYVIRVKLIEQNEVLCEKEIPLYINITDFSSLIKDFSFVIWGDVWTNTRSVETYLKQFAGSGVDIIYNYLSHRTDTEETAGDIFLITARANLKFAPYATRIAIVTGAHATIPVQDGYEIKNCPLSNTPEEQMQDPRINHLKRLAGKIGPLGPAYYTLGDENFLCFPDYFDVCFCPECLDGFREYLKNVYGSLKELNSEWNTQYENWGEVKPANLMNAYKMNRYPQWLDHRLYMEKLFTDYHASCVKAITDIDKDAIVGIEGPVFKNLSGSGFNWYRILPNFRFFGPYEGTIEIHAANSFLPRDSFTCAWFGNYTWNMVDGSVEKHVCFAPWHFLFEGLNSAGWWTSGVANVAGGEGGAAAFTPDYSPIPTFQKSSKEIKEIKSGIGKLLLSSEKETHPIALYYSNSCMHASTIRPKETFWLNSLYDFDSVLRNSGYEYLYLSPDDVKSGKLNGFRVLILPYSQAISPEEVKIIKEFVRNGGLLMADFSPGIMDEHGKLLPESSLTEVFGKFSRLNVNSYGKGKSVYLADYVKGGGKSNNGICLGVTRLISELAGVKPFAEIKDSEGQTRQDITIYSFKNGAGTYLCLLRNYRSDDALPSSITVTLPCAYHVYDVRENKYIGNLNQFNTSMEVSQAKVFALLHSQIENVEVKLNKTEYSKGMEVHFNAKLFPGSLKGSGLGIRVEILAPDGKIIPYYCQNLVSDNNSFRGTVPLSLNETTGNYKIRVKDIISGKEAEEEFKVK